MVMRIFRDFQLLFGLLLSQLAQITLVSFIYEDWCDCLRLTLDQILNRCWLGHLIKFLRCSFVLVDPKLYP